MLALLCACQPADPTKPPPAYFRLEGSLSQVMDLGYDEAKVEFAADLNDVALVFLRRRPSDISAFDGGADLEAGSRDVAFQITYRLIDQMYPLNTRYDLAEAYGDGGVSQRGVASRNVLNDPRKMFPTLQRGTLLMRGSLQPGSNTTGDFNVTFVNGVEVASGRTVFGQFTARVSQ